MTDEDLVDNAVKALMEHFDSVTIAVTRRDGGDESTTGIIKGAGNVYARVGQMFEWVEFYRGRSLAKGQLSFEADNEDEE
jgi:hypothetical protein